MGILALELPKGLSGSGCGPVLLPGPACPLRGRTASTSGLSKKPQGFRAPQTAKKNTGGKTMERSQGTALSKRSTVRVLVLLALVLGMAWPASAQSTATLQGTVTDPAGAAVPNAKGGATNQAKGGEAETDRHSAGGDLFSIRLLSALDTVVFV